MLTAEGPLTVAVRVVSVSAWTGITNNDAMIMHNTIVNEISAFFV
jgi:hypothetical protein